MRTFTPLSAFEGAELSTHDMVENFLLAPARRVVAELEANPVPAADLDDEQKSAILMLMGLITYNADGTFVSTYPVAFADREGGGYDVGVDRTGVAEQN